MGKGGVPSQFCYERTSATFMNGTNIFRFRQAQEMPKANVVWRYYRFNTTFDYYWRSSLPFPFNILGNIYLIYTRFTTKDPSAGTVGLVLSALRTARGVWCPAFHLFFDQIIGADAPIFEGRRYWNGGKSHGHLYILERYSSTVFWSEGQRRGR